MNERWRQPVVPLAIRDDEGTVTVETGRPTLDIQARFRTSDINRFRQGYACIDCWEPQEFAFPDLCSLCGYPMKKFQSADFARKFKGLERNPQKVAIEAGLDRVDDKHERNFHESKNGILIPKGIPQ